MINDKDGENIIESRVVDEKTILVSGIFYYKKLSLIATQNYIILPSGKKMMYSRISSKNGHVMITDEGIKVDQTSS